MEISLENIIVQKKMKDFLIGNISPIQDRLNDLPTNTELVFHQIVSYYEKKQLNTVWEQFEDALNEITLDKEFIFVVPIYLVSFLRYSQNRDFIVVNVAKIKENLNKGIELNKNYLQNNENWIGKNINGGLLAYINYMNSLI
jgi:hypothetical protein